MAFEYPPCTYRVSAKAAIVVGDRLVLVKEDSDDWDLPGGGLEHHETLEVAVGREVEEEIGAKLDSVDASRMQAWPLYHEEANRPLLFLVYPATISQDVQSGMNGKVEVGLFNEAELQTVPLVPYIEKFRQQLINLAFS